MRYWKEHPALRVTLIAVGFAGGLALLAAGWRMTGRLAGLGWMLVGLALLIAGLALYNKPFEEPKSDK